MKNTGRDVSLVVAKRLSGSMNNTFQEKGDLP